MRYLNCSRPERFDEFFMNGFHRLLFWSDVSCLWWLIKQWIITALAITCDKNMVWAQMTGIFFIYIDIIARLHKERRYLIIKKKKIEKKLDWTWPPRTQGFFSIQRESRLPQKTYITKSPQCTVWRSSRSVWPSMSSQCMEVAQARRVTGRVDGQLPPS